MDMIRAIHFLISLLAYAIGMGSLALFILFVGGWNVLPWGIDGKPSTSIATAIVINLSLVLLFGIQHSVMARRGIKQLITKVIPTSLERSTYCLATAVTIGLMCYCWQPLAGTAWQVENQRVRFLLTAVQLMGWALVVASSFMINHFELFGRQANLGSVDQPSGTETYVCRQVPVSFRAPSVAVGHADRYLGDARHERLAPFSLCGNDDVHYDRTVLRRERSGVDARRRLRHLPQDRPHDRAEDSRCEMAK